MGFRVYVSCGFCYWGSENVKVLLEETIRRMG